MVLSNILSLTEIISFAKSARAVKVLKECIRLKPDDATIPLLAAKLCMGSLHWVSSRRVGRAAPWSSARL